MPVDLALEQSLRQLADLVAYNIIAWNVRVGKMNRLLSATLFEHGWVGSRHCG